MPFILWARIGQRNHVLDDGPDLLMGRVNFGGKEEPIVSTLCVKKRCHPNHGYHYQFLVDLQNSFTAANSSKVPTQLILGYHYTLSVLLLYLGKLKNKKFCILMHVKHGMYQQKLVKQQYLLQICSQYGELRPTSG